MLEVQSILVKSGKSQAFSQFKNCKQTADIQLNQDASSKIVFCAELKYT